MSYFHERHCLSRQREKVIDGATANRNVRAMKQPKAPSPRKDLLDKVEAMIQAGAATKKELGEAIMPDKPEASRMARISEWVTTRRYPVSDGDVALRLAVFADSITLRMGDNEDMIIAYRKACRAVRKARG